MRGLQGTDDGPAFQWLLTLDGMGCGLDLSEERRGIQVEQSRLGPPVVSPVQVWRTLWKEKVRELEILDSTLPCGRDDVGVELDGTERGFCVT